MSNKSEWIRNEFETIKLSDPRLYKRFFKIATELSNRPSDSIHSATADWAASKASYRFFDNAEVESKKILQPHFESTSWRCKSYDRVIIAQDTSYLDYSKHKKTKGLGKSFKSHGKEVKGVCMHAGLAVSPAGLPLGLTYNELWQRKENKESGHKRTSTPIQLKESYRWVRCIKDSKKLLPDSSLVIVADREGDIYEAFEEAEKLDVDVVIRSQHDRKLDSELKLSEEIGTSPVRGQHSVVIPGNGSRKQVNAKLEVRFKKVELSACPSGQKTQQNKSRKDIELYVVDASDLENKLHWRLLTTLPVKSLKDAKEVLNYYKMRWSVELYFKMLKTGCTVEGCRLDDGGKLVKYISLMSVIAWRLFWMTYISRQDPDISCENLLMESEWKAAWWLLHRTRIKEGKMSKSDMPTSPPKLRDAIRWIAGNGGFKGRKGDGEPGMISFWRGWERVTAGAEMYELLC